MVDESTIGLLVAGVTAAGGYFWHAHASTGGVDRGFAPAMDIIEHLSPAHARRAALQTRPETRVWWWTPLRDVGIDLGVTDCQPRRELAATLEDVVLYVAGPRTGKTGRMAWHVQDAPGAVLATSTKADLWKLTRESRGRRPMRVFNPRGIGVDPMSRDPQPVSDLQWSPVIDAATPEWAALIAGMHIEAGKTGGQKEAEYWEELALSALKLLLAAANVGNLGMAEVYRWVKALDVQGALDVPLSLLESDKGERRFPTWASDLRELSGRHYKPLGSIKTTLLTCVGYMSDPVLARAATPEPHQHFRAAPFLAAGGTVYVIGKHEAHSPIGPLFSTFIGVFYEQARRLAASRAAGRLDPPCLFALDEAYATFRTPLPQWTSDAGSHGIPVIIAIQGRHQLYEAFGEHGAEIIWQNATTKITFGGNMDPDTLRDLSELCNERAPEVGSTAMRPVLTPGAIKELPPGVALILHRHLRAVRARCPMVWTRRRPPVAKPLAPLEPVPSAEVVRLDDRRPDKVA